MKLFRIIAIIAATTISMSYEAPSYAIDKPTPTSAATLLAGDSFVSPDGRFKLTFQYDGNLVLYEGPLVLWDINRVIGIPTGGYSPFTTQFQADGNLVVYWFRGGTQVVAWDANTQGHSLATLAVQNDGNVVIYDVNHRAIWRTKTCCH